MRLATAIATVGGLGRVSVAPGTWGSLVGLGLGLLGARMSPWLLSPIVLGGLFVGCVGICSRAEEQLAVHDPPAVILDEVWGMGAVMMLLPWAAQSVPLVLVAFLLFRMFDIAKPPPLKRLAELPAGLGIMADDLGAAAYTMLVLWVVSRLT